MAPRGQGLKGALAAMPSQAALQRVSPGVYRNQQGGLVQQQRPMARPMPQPQQPNMAPPPSMNSGAAIGATAGAGDFQPTPPQGFGNQFGNYAPMQNPQFAPTDFNKFNWQPPSPPQSPMPPGQAGNQFGAWSPYAQYMAAQAGQQVGYGAAGSQSRPPLPVTPGATKV